MPIKCCELNFVIEETNIELKVNEEDIDLKIDGQYVVSPTASYSLLSDKPEINYNVLKAGNNTYDYLGVQPTMEEITEQDIDEIIYGG